MINKNGDRWVTLDAIKAIGIVLIIIEHIVVWWFIDLDYGTNSALFNQKFFFVFLNSVIFFTGLVPFAAGTSLRLYIRPIQGGKHNSLDRNFYYKRIFVKAIGLMLLGYLLNYLAFGLEDLFAWDVLQFLALSITVTIFIVKFGSVLILAMTGALNLILAPYLHEILDLYQNQYWALVLVGNRSGHHFWPFFPWFSIFVLGFLIGHHYINFKSKNKVSQMRILFTILGTTLLILAIVKKQVFFKIYPENFWGPNIFQPPTFTLVGAFGFAFLTVAFFDIMLSKIKKLGKYNVVNSFSKGVLWIFVLHIIIGYNLVSILKNTVAYHLYTLFLVIIFMLFFSYIIGVICILLKEKGLKINF
ncbi:DUF1624 domain-containing protein [Candidatus Woesearchaeota archaeon]|nr:DUF1624 domain-containing protein [Candidatus Woesearchaeota archaeon]